MKTSDNRLDLSEHINDACEKASQRIGVLMRLKNLVSATAKVQLFKAAVLRDLAYCHLIWHFAELLIGENWNVSKREEYVLSLTKG